jgi:sulfate transport system substrate-binding protein
VATFNQVTDVQILHDQGDLIAADWQSRLPNNSVPSYSLPAFLVRKGNPKNIKDWSDLVRDDVKVVFPNPKTSGNGRYTYLAAYAYALETFKGDKEKTQAFVRKLFANVPVFTQPAARRPPPSSSTTSATCSSPSRRRCRASAASTARTGPTS